MSRYNCQVIAFLIFPLPTQFDESSPLHPVEPLLFYQSVFLLIITGTDDASNL